MANLKVTSFVFLQDPSFANPLTSLQVLSKVFLFSGGIAFLRLQPAVAGCDNDCHSRVQKKCMFMYRRYSDVDPWLKVSDHLPPLHMFQLLQYAMHPLLRQYPQYREFLKATPAESSSPHDVHISLHYLMVPHGILVLRNTHVAQIAPSLCL